MNLTIGVCAVSAALLALGLLTPSGTQQKAAQPQDKGVADAAAPMAKVHARSQSENEKRRQAAEQQAEKTLDREAMAAIEETRNAVKAIGAGKGAEAIAAIERATGKIAILTARNPATANLPVAIEVEVIESAPMDLRMIEARADAVERALDDRDYPAARVLLDGLVSEIRVRTAHLPLATYPHALREAARLLEARRNDEATVTLTTALNTLLVIDRVIPLPLTVAQAAIEEAEAKRESDKDGALKLLAIARHEIERAKALGYAGKDAEYKSLNDAIAQLEDQVRGKDDTGSLFTKLKLKFATFFDRESRDPKSSEVAMK